MSDPIAADTSEIATVEAAIGVGNKPVLAGLECYGSRVWR